MNDWISVEAERPPSGAWFVGLGPRTIEDYGTATFTDARVCYEDDQTLTHWLPLPLELPVATEI